MKALFLSFMILMFLMPHLTLGQVENSDDCAIAPINLAYFTVHEQGRDFALNWATTSERKNTRVELQKSFNGRQFETLEVFKSANRNTLKTYTYLDKTPFERTAHEVKVIYYRLKQIEDNQIYTYSEVLTIIRETEGQELNDSKPTF